MNLKIKTFISYPHSEKEVFEKLIPIIEECNIEVIHINKPITGVSFSNQIKTSIASSDIFMPLITEESSKRGWPHQEIGFANALNIPVILLTTYNFHTGGMLQEEMHVLKIDDEIETFKQLLIKTISEILTKFPKKPIEPPFEAYSGPESYLFVSYSHKDNALVYPEIDRLHQLGFRIWYDEGIDPGNEWPEEVALALDKCSFFLVFITPRSVDSQNVKNEINFAINHNKPFLAIHVEETMLPKGLELRMGDIQAILKWRMQEERYFRQMEKTIPISLLNDTK